MFLMIFTFSKTCIVKCGLAEFVTPRSDNRNSSEYHINLSPVFEQIIPINFVNRTPSFFSSYFALVLSTNRLKLGVSHHQYPPFGMVLTIHTHMAWYFIKLPPKILVKYYNNFMPFCSY